MVSLPQYEHAQRLCLCISLPTQEVVGVFFFISINSLALMREQRVSVSEKVRIAQASAFICRDQCTR